jgi:hypothetical protein
LCSCSHWQFNTSTRGADVSVTQHARTVRKVSLMSWTVSADTAQFWTLNIYSSAFRRGAVRRNGLTPVCRATVKLSAYCLCTVLKWSRYVSNALCQADKGPHGKVAEGKTKQVARLADRRQRSAERRLLRAGSAVST